MRPPPSLRAALVAAALATAAATPAAAQPGAATSLPTLSVAGISVAEGDSGDTIATFTVGLSARSARTVTVQVATQDGTALAADGDFTPLATTLTFDPGATAQTVDVIVRGDVVEEPDEIFFLVLARPAGATLGAAARAEGEIVDDDGAAGPGEGPGLAIEGAQVTERDSGRTRLRFVVTLSSPSPVPVTVSWAAADGSATVDEDYLAASGTLRFPRGATTRTIEVPVLGDAVEEGDEEVVVSLTDPVGAVVLADTAVGVILDDDAPGTLRLEQVGELERRGRPGRTLVLEVRLVDTAGEPVAGAPVHWELDGDGALLDGPTTATNRSGRARQRVQLGGPGRLAVRAHDESGTEVVLYQISVSAPVGP